MTAMLYTPVPATIDRIDDETPTIKTFGIRPREPLPFAAGQFVELTVPGISEAPFTPSSSPRITERMEITIMKTGRVTDCLHELATGAEVGVRGPYGRAYPLDEFKGKEILLAGGGCGVGPLRALLLELIEDIDAYERVILRYGARSPDDLVFREAASRGWDRGDALDVMMTVDAPAPGWKGHVGVLPEILEPEFLECDPHNGVVVICGPPVMMRFTVDKLLERGYRPHDIYLSLERNMSCGVGKCGHCRMGRYHVCVDGPVFPYDEISTNPRLWND